jgi:hypothetical protein
MILKYTYLKSFIQNCRDLYLIVSRLKNIYLVVSVIGFFKLDNTIFVLRVVPSNGISFL